MTPYKQLPAGISDFRQLRRQNRYYVDKTMYIPKVELSGNFLFLIRPRRFGKSLFLSMLYSYYDLAQTDQFDKWFDGLWIQEHPTELRGQYQVIYLDFSKMGYQSLDDLPTAFNEYCCIKLDIFANTYKDYYPNGFVEEVKAFERAASKFNYIDNIAKELGHRLYLIVDEYDNFTNDVLNEHGEQVYHALTHATGFYRTMFKLFKGMFERILMMGVSPVTLDDLTSGYNIATNITRIPEFNQMLGLSEVDVREMIRYYQSFGLLPADAEETMIAEMKPWYNNYCFAEESLHTDPKMFNCYMTVYYISNYLRSRKAPEQMIDPNTKSDYGKMKKIIQLDKLDDTRRSLLHKIVQDGYIYNRLEESFPAERLYDKDKFVSLLFYYGMLTISGTRLDLLKLAIPNNNVRLQLYKYLLEEYENIWSLDFSLLRETFVSAALDGEWRPMMELITSAYRENSSVRQLIQGERNLQGFMNAYLTLNSYYLTAPEVEVAHGYCDFFLMPDVSHYPDVAHAYILELKYLKPDATATETEQQWADATEQIRGYATGGLVPHFAARRQLHLVVVQLRGLEVERMEEILPMRHP